MSLNAGTRLGPYEILGPLGAGGMGEVYKARDTRLDRTVAVKVLPADFVANADLRERFEREAKLIAALSHPHICALHDVGRQEDTDFLVMEHLDGETLEKRLMKGALAVDQALTLAIQIADALAAAHRAGIVHRDLKPSNIMLTRTGAKLLDFGLAKAGAPAVAGRLSMLPTTPPGLTQQGTILGTFQYMAPEQLEGRDADARSDIFAFSAVLYEMLTGRKAFEATSHAGLIAAILDRDPPPVSSVEPKATSALDRIVGKCLAKAPEARWQSAADLHDELRWIIDSRLATVSARAQQVTGSKLGQRTLAAVAVLALAAVAVDVWWPAPNPASTPAVIRFEIPTPPTAAATSFAVSSDGRQLAYVATTEGQSRLWVRALNETAARSIPGTEGATFPFWAPDGQALGFFADAKLKRVDLVGGAPQVLADAPFGRGGTWNSDDVIVFTPDAGAQRLSSVLMRISASGGTPVPVTRLGESERSHRWPQFLPDGRRFLFFSALTPEIMGVYLGSLDAVEARRLLATDTPAVFVPPNRLLFVRDDVLMGTRFDPDAGTIEGEPLPLAQPIGRDDGAFANMVSAAPEVLAYRTAGGGQVRQLVWMDRTGKPLAAVGVADESGPGGPELDPSGQRVAVGRNVLRNFDVWLMDTVRGIPTRFTFAAAYDGQPVWSPDGRRMAFLAVRGGRDRLYEKSASGAGDEQLLAEDAGTPLSWSPDGRFLLYARADANTGADLWVLAMSGERKPAVAVQTAMDQRGGEFSPDGRWLAYESNESGRFEVYIQPWPEGGGKWQVSSAGGTQVRWRRDGRELYYIAPDARLTAVSVTAGPDGKTLELGVPMPLFHTRLATGPSAVPGKAQYAVAPDGRFLMNTVVANTAPAPITVIVNWTQLLAGR